MFTLSLGSGVASLVFVAYPLGVRIVGAPPRSASAVVVRLLGLVVLSAASVSLGALYAVAYFALPMVATFRRSAVRPLYSREEETRFLSVMEWVLAATSWLGMVIEDFPRQSAREAVMLTLDPNRRALSEHPLSRIVSGLPSALVLAFLSAFGVIAWLGGAAQILFGDGLTPSVHNYLTGLQRYSYRLLAYQAGLVAEYPPWNLGDDVPRGDIEPSDIERSEKALGEAPR